MTKKVCDTDEKGGYCTDFSVPEWLQKKYDVFDNNRFPSPEEVQSRLDVLFGAKNAKARHREGVGGENIPLLTFGEREFLLETVRNLFPSLRRLTHIEIDDHKTDGRLIRLDPTSAGFYLHPIIFKLGFRNGESTVYILVLAATFAATLVGRVGQGVLATLYFLPFLIVQICSNPHLQSKQVSQTFDLLESLGWDVSPLANYWREVSSALSGKNINHHLSARRGLYSWVPLNSLEDGDAFTPKSKGVGLSSGLLTRLQRITRMGSDELIMLLVDIGIYESLQNPVIKSDFRSQWSNYVECLLDWFHIPSPDSVSIAGDIVVEGFESVSFPLREYVSRSTGEVEASLIEVEKLKWSWPTEREATVFSSSLFGKPIDPNLRKLMIMASRSFRNVSLDHLFAFHSLDELKSGCWCRVDHVEGHSRAYEESLLKVYGILPSAFRFLGADCCKSLVERLNFSDRVLAFLPLTALPIYHEGLECDFKKRAVLFERIFTGNLNQDLAEVARSRPLLDLFFQKILVRATEPENRMGTPTPPLPLAVYYHGLQRFGFLVTDTTALVERFGSRARRALSVSALNALDLSEDTVVRRFAFNSLELFADDVDAMKGVSIAIGEIESAPVVVSDTDLSLTLDAAARFIAAKGDCDALDRFFRIIDENPKKFSVAPYLIGAFYSIFVFRRDTRALMKLINACEKGAEIAESWWALVLKCDAARDVFNGLDIDSIKFFLTHPSLSKQNRALARSLLGEEKTREVLSSVDASVRQRSMEGASDSEVHTLFGADKDIHNQRALFARRAYVESARSAQKWVTDLFLNERKLNYYAVLGLPFGANPDQVKFSYRLLAASFHSDRVVSKEDKAVADKQMREINEAYAVLSKDEKRAPYDEMIVRNRLDTRPNILPTKPWYTASSLMHLHLQPPPSTFYKAQRAVGMTQFVAKKLLG